MPKRKKMNVMRAFKLNEISAVDNPAQEGAQVVIMKRAEPRRDPLRVDVKKALDLLKRGKAALTTSTDGHTHLLALEDYDGVEVASGVSSWQEEHAHPWVSDESGNITIGETQDHTHEVASVSKVAKLTEERLADLLKEDASKAAETLGADPEENRMPGPEKKAADDNTATIEKLQKDNADLTKKLEKATAVATLTDSQRVHYGKLSEAEQDAFLAKSADDRDKDVKDAVKKAADDNPVVYKAADGSEFRKNDDPRLVSMAKKMDADAEENNKLRKAAEDADIKKAVETDYKNLAGSDEAKTAIIKAVRGIEDEDVRTEALKALKAHNAQMAGAFKSVGSDGEDAEPITTRAEAEAELEKRAKDLQKKDAELTYEQAYEKAAEADPSLYSKAVGV